MSDAVTQCIDYAAALNAQGPEQIGRLISKYSGERGIEEIEDFEEWSQERFPENDLSGPWLQANGAASAARWPTGSC